MTTILNFGYFLKLYGLCKVLFEEVNKYLKNDDLDLRDGRIVPEAIISVRSFTTKNKSGQRHPKLNQTKTNEFSAMPGTLAFESGITRAPRKRLMVHCQAACNPAKAGAGKKNTQITGGLCLKIPIFAGSDEISRKLTVIQTFHRAIFYGLT